MRETSLNQASMIIAALASATSIASATGVPAPFLNSQLCAAGYVPGTPQKGCVKDVDPALLKVEGAKRSNSSTNSSLGVATVAPASNRKDEDSPTKAQTK